MKNRLVDQSHGVILDLGSDTPGWGFTITFLREPPFNFGIVNRIVQSNLKMLEPFPLDGAPIPGATSAKYTPTAADAGALLSFAVTARGIGLPSQLSAVSGNVAVGGGSATDTRKPHARLAGARTQDIDKLSVTVTLDEAGTVSATGTVRVQNSSKTYRFKLARKSARAGAKVKLRLKLSRKAKRAVKRS